MSEVTVRQLADTVGVPLERLITQLGEAGLNANSADDVLSDDEKVKLLSYLRGSHGKQGDSTESPKKVTLKRRSLGELRQSRSTGAGRTTKAVSVEVRKRHTYIKKSELTDSDTQLKEIEKARQELDEQRLKTEAEEAARAEREAQLTKQKEAEEQEKQKQIEQQRLAEQREQEKLKQEETHKQQPTQEQQTQSADQLATQPHQAVSQQQPPGKTETPQKKEDKPARKTKQKGKPADSRKQLHVREDGRRKKKGARAVKPQNIVRDREHGFEKPSQPIVYDVEIPESITVQELAKRMSVKATEVIKTLMGMGVMTTINQSLDQETAVLIVEELGHTAVMQTSDGLEQEMLSTLVIDDDSAEPRAPVVTIMGHVDHGKTSLLDYIRSSRVAAGEAGGITQHIGAYKVKTDHGSVTFLDTPGHAAFTAMRARGAQVTDVVVIVVAADDGVMPQTKEAIEHAKAANVPIVIAVNKMDKENADPDRVKNELAAIQVIPEDWGGDTQFVPVSAMTGQGVDELLEALILQTELLELTSPTKGLASGVVIESRLDKGRGPVATVLVQKGQLNQSDIVLAGTEFGRVRAMVDEYAKPQKTAGPSTPVEILGLSGAPDTGVDFQVVTNERQARELAEHRAENLRSSKIAEQQKAKLDNMFSQMASGDVLELNLLMKTDVRGSLEALRESLVKLSTEQVKVNVVYAGIGGINESDANLALASNAVMIGFNVRADATARRIIESQQIDLHYYSVIYDAIDQVKQSISGLLGPVFEEQIVGIAEVRDVFRSPKLGAIAGCMVTEGRVSRNLPIRVLRDNVVIYEGTLESLRRFKDDVSEVKAGMECGIGVKNYNDVKVGDQIEVYERVEVDRSV
ncbi:MAG: translation initiation factor IF-2 [Gammaproteobacteria bacterium]|nr:translation initiation factor IF-2 [Gammaproteobacteria bacterium]